MSGARWHRYLRFWRRDVRADVDDEIRFHFEARIEELIARGVAPNEARRQASAEFGDVDEVRRGLQEIDNRVARRRDRAAWLDALRQDVVYAARSLRRTPVVSLTIIATLALGLGANAAMFSLLDGVFFKPPAAVMDPGGVSRLWYYYKFRNGSKFWPGFDYTSYEAVAEAVSGRAETALYRGPDRLPLSAGDDPPTASVLAASASYFRILGVRAERGRVYSSDEDALDTPAPVVVVSDAFWHRELNGDPQVLGRTISLGTKQHTIIGVAAARFTGVDLDAVDVWRPLASAFNPAATPWYRNININGFQVLLRPAASARQTELEQRVTARLHVGTRLAADTIGVAKFGSIISARGPGNLDPSVQVATRLAGVAIIVLVIACANVVNLLLARAVRRRREIAIRLSLGVSRSRLARMLVTESALLALVAAAAAIVAALWGGALLRRLLLPDVHWAESPLNWRVTAFGIAVALVAGTIAGLAPALQSLSVDLASALKSGARDDTPRRSRLRSSLIVVQAALSVVLLVGAALFVRSLSNVQSRDIGFTVDRLAFVATESPVTDSATRAARVRRLVTLEPRLGHLPGVERVAYASMRPLGGFQSETYFPEADTLAHKKPLGFFTAVSAGFFDAVGERLVRGRDFPREPAPGAPKPVIVNEAMAKALWPSENPIGRCLRFESANAICAPIIGVSQNAVLLSATESPEPRFYVQLDNVPFSTYDDRIVILRAAPGRTAAATDAVRALVRAEIPGVRTRAYTMSSTLEPQYRPWKLGATLFSLFGILALVVAGVGVYSSVSYGVTQRFHEFGIRAALGATRGNVVSQVLGEGLRTVGIGVAIGIVLAIAGGRLIASLLYGVTPGDPGAMVIAMTLLLGIAGAASIVPAWRAAKADPVEALRAE